MNILKREIKSGFKAFLFWTLGLFVLLFIGLVKFTGVAATGDMMKQLFDTFPKIVIAVMGMGGIDLTSFAGFYAVLAQYSTILVAIYAVHLGNSAVSKELVDKTYEFIFTRPRKRGEILFPKLLAGFVYLTIYCFLFFLFAQSSALKLGFGEGMSGLFVKTALSAWLVGLIFFSLGSLFAAFARSSEVGAKLGNFSVLAAYILAVAYDMSEETGLIRLISPLRYFPSSDMAKGEFELIFAFLSLFIALVGLTGAFYFFEKKDLQAV